MPAKIRTASRLRNRPSPFPAADNCHPCGTPSDMVNRAYLDQTLRRPLPLADGRVLRTLADAAQCVVALPNIGGGLIGTVLLCYCRMGPMPPRSVASLNSACFTIPSLISGLPMRRHNAPVSRSGQALSPSRMAKVPSNTFMMAASHERFAFPQWQTPATAHPRASRVAALSTFSPARSL
jgi:hypothetical protein